MRAVFTIWIFLCLAMVTPQAQISVQGVQDVHQYAPPAGFYVDTSSGFEYQATLNGQAAPVATWVTVTEPGFYVLDVRCLNLTDQTASEQSFRFVIMDPIRGDAEWGLAPWVPRPFVDSSSNELSQAGLKLVAPARFPLGMDVPLVALLEDSQGRSRWLNGWAEGSANFPVKRGYGHGFVTGATNPAVDCQLTLGPLQASRSLSLQASPEWLVPLGEVTNNTVWPSNSFVHVTSSFTIATGAVLVVEAGTVVKLDPGVEITVAGKLAVEGAVANPVVFAPSARNRPWGGIVCWQAPAELEITGAIFTGSGADSTWFISHGIGSSHRKEEALFYLGTGVKAAFNRVFMVANQGQAFHGENATLNLDHCLIQQSQTGGQFNGGNVTVIDSGIMDFPTNNATYVDGDNDAFYFSLGTHTFIRDVIGWTKDDGLDAGADTAGWVTVSNCWFESCFHEGMALSGTGKQVQVTNSVFLNCEQGVESGYLSPQVYVTHCLLAANEVGARFGDNYSSAHSGWLQVANSYCLFNRRDVWGMDRSVWLENTARMDIRSNYLAVANPLFPGNEVWQPAHDASQLAAFSPVTAVTVGVGFLESAITAPLAVTNPVVEVGLSSFSTNTVSVDYTVTGGTAQAGAHYALAAGTLTFLPGQIYQSIPLEILPGAESWLSRTIQITLTNAVNAEIATRQAAQVYTITARTGQVVLVNAGDAWAFHKGTNEPAIAPGAWRSEAFDDSAWLAGMAPLGYGDGTNGTALPDMPGAYSTVYLRKKFLVESPEAITSFALVARYAGGFIIWINGVEMARVEAPGEPGEEMGYAAVAATADNSAKTWSQQWTQSQLRALVPGTNVIAVQALNSSLTAAQFTFSLASSVVLSSDSDGDGLPDAWEQAIVDANSQDGINTAADVLGGDDFDHDGMSNRAEFIAGTAPADPASRLELSVERSGGQTVVLRFQQVAGRAYVVESCAGLDHASQWMPLANFSGGAGLAEIEEALPVGGSARFYRIRVRNVAENIGE